MTRALDAAHASQGQLNAFTLIDDDAALDRAEAIDRAIAEGQDPGPLAGVPIALKDLIDHAGRVTTCGSAFYRHLATETASCVKALEDAGAVIVGRTGLHEWAFGFSSENPHFGAVRNPWDVSTSAGGSSGGSGAAVAAGITPIAIGTDTGGSVRVPAALCGTFGLKVTHGRIPLDGVFPLVPSADTVGPLADSVANLELAYRAMSGDTARGDENLPRLGIPQPWYDDSPISDEIAGHFEAAAAALRDIGCEVVPVEVEGAVPARELVYSIAEEVTAVHREFRAQGRPYGEDVADRLERAAVVTDGQKSAAVVWREMIKDAFARAFTNVDVLITPSVPVRRKVIGEDLIDGLHYRTVLSYFSSLVNQSLHPAIAMPLRDTGSPPASLQAIGRLGSEPSLLSFASTLEQTGITEFGLAPMSPSTSGGR